MFEGIGYGTWNGSSFITSTTQSCLEIFFRGPSCYIPWQDSIMGVSGKTQHSCVWCRCVRITLNEQQQIRKCERLKLGGQHPPQETLWVFYCKWLKLYFYHKIPSENMSLCQYYIFKSIKWWYIFHYLHFVWIHLPATTETGETQVQDCILHRTPIISYRDHRLTLTYRMSEI